MTTNQKAAMEIESPYLHGTDPEEQVRLSRLNEILNAASLHEMGLENGKRLRILDVGCGLAQLTRAMARTIGPGSRVLGIERSGDQLAEAARQAREAGEEDLVELRRGDALSLPLDAEEWGSFDVAHTRFLLEHVPDPLSVVRQMVRAVRPGGRIILEDDTHDTMRLWPEAPGFAPLWNAYLRAYDRLGTDPFVGHRLVSLLHDAGAVPVRNTWIFFGSCAGHPHFPLYVQNVIGLFRGARDRMVGPGLVDAGYFEEGIENLITWSRRPDAALWLAAAWAEGKAR